MMSEAVHVVENVDAETSHRPLPCTIIKTVMRDTCDVYLQPEQRKLSKHGISLDLSQYNQKLSCTFNYN